MGELRYCMLYILVIGLFKLILQYLNNMIEGLFPIIWEFKDVILSNNHIASSIFTASPFLTTSLFRSAVVRIFQLPAFFPRSSIFTFSPIKFHFLFSNLN